MTLDYLLMNEACEIACYISSESQCNILTCMQYKNASRHLDILEILLPDFEYKQIATNFHIKENRWRDSNENSDSSEANTPRPFF